MLIHLTVAKDAILHAKNAMNQAVMLALNALKDTIFMEANAEPAILIVKIVKA